MLSVSKVNGYPKNLSLLHHPLTEVSLPTTLTLPPNLARERLRLFSTHGNPVPRKQRTASDYSIPCHDGEHIYTAQISHKFGTCLKKLYFFAKKKNKKEFSLVSLPNQWLFIAINRTPLSSSSTLSFFTNEDYWESCHMLARVDFDEGANQSTGTKLEVYWKACPHYRSGRHDRWPLRQLSHIVTNPIQQSLTSTNRRKPVQAIS